MIRKSETTRRCKKCGGAVLPGEFRCFCSKVRPRRIKAKQGSPEAAHYFQLFKSIRTGSWARTGYVSPHTNLKAQRRILRADGEGRQYQIRTSRSRSWSSKAIEFFIYRCELARHYWRSEFDGLMGTRMELLAAGYTKQKVCDFLGIPRESLLWLDREIKKFGIRFPGRAVVIRSEYDKLRRKMKQGVAGDIIRRRRHGYKQSQVLQYQQVNPFSDK